MTKEDGSTLMAWISAAVLLGLASCIFASGFMLGRMTAPNYLADWRSYADSMGKVLAAKDCLIENYDVQLNACRKGLTPPDWERCTSTNPTN